MRMPQQMAQQGPASQGRRLFKRSHGQGAGRIRAGGRDNLYPVATTRLLNLSSLLAVQMVDYCLNRRGSLR